MKKVEKYIYIIIALVLVAIITSGITYYLVKNKENENLNSSDIEQENSKNNDKVEFKSVKEENNKIVEIYEVNLNGKAKNLVIEYALDGNFFIGKNGDTELYMEEVNDDSQIETIKENLLKRNFEDNDFYFIKGDDNKTYLGIATKDSTSQVRLTILNDELKVINNNFTNLGWDSLSNNDEHYSMILYEGAYSFQLADDKWMGYTQNNCPSYMENCNVMLKIVDNKIYYLTPVIDANNKGYIEERVYSIINSEMSYRVTNRNEIINSVGTME